MNRRQWLHGLAGFAGAAGFAPIRRALAADANPVPTARAPMIAGPDPNTRIPAFNLPKGTIDTHCHVFGPVSQYPYAPDRPYTPPEAPYEMLRALDARLGIARAVLVNATVYGRDNKIVLDAIARSGGSCRGIGNVDDKFSDKELEALDRGGLDGCRFTFLSRLGGMPDMASFDRVVERVAPLGWHVDLYLEAKTLAGFIPKLRKLPVPYVIDHMGAVDAAQGLDQPGFVALLGLLATDEKCWVKITGPERMSATGAPFRDAAPFAEKLIATAPDRVIWGTDWPHPNVKLMPNDGDLVDLIPLYAPDPAVQRKLLVENPGRLFRFKG
jgi:2-pyrone-4,6-dicarboxylate lactonase